MPPPGLRRACLLGGLALGSLTSVLLLLSWHRERLVPSTPAAPLRRQTISALSDGSVTFRFNRSAYEAHFPHLQLYRCQEAIARDGLCQGPSGVPLLLLAIKSHPAASGRRATLRRTWAQPAEMGGFRLRPLFLMGATSNPKHLELVALESRVFGDILRWDFMESHHNLSLKERCFLRWVHGHCQQAAFVFKGDDDLFVNPKVLTDYLRRTPNASHFIHGNIQAHSTVMRWGKYAVSRDFYPLDHYPNFASGGGFIMSRVGLAALYRASLELPVFPLDDIYLAFLMLAAKIPHRHDRAFRVWGIPKDELSAYRRSVCIHGVSMERIEEVWKQLERTPEDPLLMAADGPGLPAPPLTGRFFSSDWMVGNGRLVHFRCGHVKRAHWDFQSICFAHRGPSCERLSHVFVSKWCLGLAAVLLVSSAVRKWYPPLPATLALTDGTFTFYFNRSSYKAHFPHLQLYRCQEVIARDDLCQGPSGVPLLLLAIKSHPISGDMRAILRSTWAQPAEVGGFRLRPLFLMGSTFNQKHLELVVRETRMFGDILMWDFMESHHNLALKERCFLRWAYGHCQQAAFVFKGEEDVFVNPTALTKFLRQTPNASHFIHGYIHFHPAVKRIGRDAIPVPFFPLAHYPHFASEKGFLVPGAALPALYQASLWLPTFPLCGAYWGFLALAAQLPHQHSGDFRTWEKTQDHLSTYQRSLVVHGVPKERIEEVWQELRGSGQGWPK